MTNLEFSKVLILAGGGFTLERDRSIVKEYLTIRQEVWPNHVIKSPFYLILSKTGTARFKLAALINIRELTQGLHYVAYVRNGNVWNLCNDGDVDVVSFSTVQQLQEKEFHHMYFFLRSEYLAQEHKRKERDDDDDGVRVSHLHSLTSQTHILVECISKRG